MNRGEFTVKVIELKEMEVRLARDGRGERPPVRTLPALLSVHCHQCDAHFTLGRSSAGPKLGFVFLARGRIQIKCPGCLAERVIASMDIEDEDDR